MAKARATGAGPSQRQLRVGELVRHALADILQRDALPEIGLSGVVVTVPEVRMSPDLKLATAYVMPLGGKDAEKVAATLEKHRRAVRGELGRRVELKSVPEVRFRVDTSFDEGARIDALLQSPRVRRDVDAPEDTPEGENN
jgi:ribosome-binding factor A